MLERMSEETIQSVVSTAIEDACDFIESEIAPDRMKAQRYFNGECDVVAEDGRSQLVATKVRDTIRAVKPSLMRVFLQTDKPVEFVPTGPEDVAAAEQATKYVNWLFQKQNGYDVINDVFHDALVKKVGIARAAYKETETTEIIPFEGVPLMEFEAIAADDDVEVLEYADNGDGTVSGKLSRPGVKGEIIIESIPPEEFIIDRNATSLKDFYICGHRTTGRKSDLIEMGFEWEEIEDLDEDENDLEEYERDGFTDDENILDPSMQEVTITQAFMRVDIEGTGIPKMYQFTCGGSANKVLRYDPVDDVEFAAFEVDPEPHTFFGRSLAELIMQDQDAATAFLRGMADNVYATNNPGIAYDENAVNPHDVLNNEFGRMWRTKGPPGAAIYEMQTPFMAAQVLPFLQYYDQTVEERSGVSRASLGLNPNALRGSTATAVDAAVAGAEGQMEVIARNLAEGGMKRLFRLLLKLTKKHADPNVMMQVAGSFQPVDPGSWSDEMDMSVNIGLGTGGEEEKKLALRETLQNQMTIFTQGGPNNGMVSMTNIYNTLADILSHSGLRNADRYFIPMTPEREQQMLEAQAQQQQPEPQPDPTIVAGEQIRAQASVQKAQIDSQTKMQLEAMRDDRERDKTDTETILEAVKLLGEYGIKVPMDQVQRAQAMPRQFPL